MGYYVFDFVLGEYLKEFGCGCNRGIVWIVFCGECIWLWVFYDEYFGYGYVCVVD